MHIAKIFRIEPNFLHIKVGPQARVAAAAAAAAAGRDERYRCTSSPTLATCASSVRRSPSTAPSAACARRVYASACSPFLCSLSNFPSMSSLRRMYVSVDVLAPQLASRPFSLLGGVSNGHIARASDGVVCSLQGMIVASLPGPPLSSSISNRFSVSTEKFGVFFI